MWQITAPEILWRIFTLVESKADLARAGRLNKFIGAIALDVLWAEIGFKSFLSLFPAEITRMPMCLGIQLIRTNILLPLLPMHWEKIDKYAWRVRTLRCDLWTDLNKDQVLTSLSLCKRGPDHPYILPRLKCLTWNCYSHNDGNELSVIATLFFTPTLQELSIRTLMHHDEGDASPSESALNYGHSLLIPLKVISESKFVALKRLYLPLPLLSTESLEKYHLAVINLLHNLPKGHLEEISSIFTKDILHILSAFPNLHSLEMHELPTNPFESSTSGLSKDDTAFDNLRSLKIYHFRPEASMHLLNFFQCAPSHHIEVWYDDEGRGGSGTFHEMIQLLHPRRNTLESLDVCGTLDLTKYAKWLLTLPKLKQICLGRKATLNIRNDILRLISAEWNEITSLSISHHDNQFGYISLHGNGGPNNCLVKSFKLRFAVPQTEQDEIVNLDILLEWLFTFPNLEELSLEPGIALNISDDILRRMSAKWRSLTRLSISHNRADLVSLKGIVAFLTCCPIKSFCLSFILTQKDIIHFQDRINNSQITPLYSLEKFDLVRVTNGFGTNVTGAAFVLTWLFPNTEFKLPCRYLGQPELGARVREAFRVRTVVLKMLSTQDVKASIIQALTKE